MTFIGIFMAYNMDSFLCWVCSVKGALEVQAGFVNELLSVTASCLILTSMFLNFYIYVFLFIFIFFLNSLSYFPGESTWKESSKYKGMHHWSWNTELPGIFGSL